MFELMVIHVEFFSKPVDFRCIRRWNFSSIPKNFIPETGFLGEFLRNYKKIGFDRKNDFGAGTEEPCTKSHKRGP